MAIHKEITEDNELLLWMNGTLIYKRWLNRGYSKVFDRMAYGKDTFMSIVEDEKGTIRKRWKIFIDGYTCNSQKDFWNTFTDQIAFESAKSFGKNLDAFYDAITSGAPGNPGVCIIEIVGTKRLYEVFGEKDFEHIIELLQKADFVELITEEVTK